MIKRGPITAISGIVMILIFVSIVFTTPSSTFRDGFDEISDEIEIMPGDTAFFSYSTLDSDELKWAIEIIDFESGDELSVTISNILGDAYDGEFILDTHPARVGFLQLSQPDTINFEMTNVGSDSLTLVIMLSEDPEISQEFIKRNPPSMNTILSSLILGFLLILGVIASVIGSIVILVDLKNNQNNKRNY